MADARPERWLGHFRRVLKYLRPHRRPLIMGLVAALGVGLFYTFSLSSTVPILKVLFAEHESLTDWLYRAEAERRLGVVFPADVPDDPAGVPIDNIRDTSPAAGVLRSDSRITAIGSEPAGSYALLRRIAEHPGTLLPDVRVADATGVRVVALPLRPHREWWDLARRAATLMPAGRSAEDRFRVLLILTAALVVVAVLGGLSRFINEGLVATAVQRAMHDLRTDLADHTLRLPVQWHSLQPSGDTLSRFATDIGKVEVGLSTLFGKVAREPLKALGVLSLAVLLDWQMLVIAVLGLPIGAIVIRAFGRLVKRAQQRASESWGRLLDHLGERLLGIRVVKAYGMESAESQRFESEGRELTRAQTHIELVDAASNPVLEVLASIAVAAFILYGGARVFNQQLEPHLLFGAVVCLGGVFDPLRKMGNVNNRLQQADASARRLFEVLDLPAERSAPATAGRELPRFQRAIEFRNVSFAYPSSPHRLVLDGIDLTVQRGQVVALVGANGSGKTTLVSLLLRFFEPRDGAILIDGHNIAEVTLESLRQQIGLVTQDAIVFSDTVRANIAYGANGVTEEAVRRAARLAHVEEFVDALRIEQGGAVSSGYDAPVSNRTLSGGQRQRIVIARAILRDPPILILDEATSQVDSESERKIQEALEDVTRDRTTFIIAHRFSTIARADLIVVLDAGRIVGQGRHDELMRTCPFYVTLVRTQFAQGV